MIENLVAGADIHDTEVFVVQARCSRSIFQSNKTHGAASTHPERALKTLLARTVTKASYIMDPSAKTVVLATSMKQILQHSLGLVIMELDALDVSGTLVAQLNMLGDRFPGE